MKIHIVGCSGSGKTYIANALSMKSNLPHYDLDNLYWDNEEGYGKERPKEERMQMLAQIIQQTDWILEGVYYAWLEYSFQEADVIYFLEIPSFIYKYRIIKRFIKRKLQIEKGHHETFTSLWNLLRWTKKYEQINKVETKAMLIPYQEKVIYLSSKKEIAHILEEHT